MSTGDGLAINEVTVRFGDTVAVDSVTLSIATGSICALVGPSGCGKSTLLRAVAGLVTPTSGQIQWQGNDLTAVAVHRRGIGLMFQQHALFSHRDVAANVGFGLRMSGSDRRVIDQRVSELLAMVGLAGFEARSIDTLSGGEAQRVALARTLAPEPALLLLDEPLASLDRARRGELNAELARLLRELGQTAIYVSHDQVEAFAVADQVGVMHAGKLLRVGTPAEVWADPQSEVVARFIGHETIIEVAGCRVAVPAKAVKLMPRGPGLGVGSETKIDVVVRQSVFAGDRFEVQVASADGMTYRCYSDDDVEIGTECLVVIDPAACPRLND